MYLQLNSCGDMTVMTSSTGIASRLLCSVANTLQEALQLIFFNSLTYHES